MSAAIFIAALSVTGTGVSLGLFSCITHRGGTFVTVLACLLLFAALELWLLYAGSQRQDLVGLVVLLAISSIAFAGVLSSMRSSSTGGGVVDDVDDDDDDEDDKEKNAMPPAAGAFIGGVMSLVAMLFATTYFLWPLTSTTMVMAGTLVVDIAGFTVWSAWRVRTKKRSPKDAKGLQEEAKFTGPRPSASLWAVTGISLAMNRMFVIMSVKTTNVQFISSIVLACIVIVYSFIAMIFYQRWLEKEKEMVAKVIEAAGIAAATPAATFVVDGKVVLPPQPSQPSQPPQDIKKTVTPMESMFSCYLSEDDEDDEEDKKEENEEERGKKLKEKLERRRERRKRMQVLVCFLLFLLILLVGGAVAGAGIVSPVLVTNIVGIIVMAVLLVLFVAAMVQGWRYVPKTKAERVGRKWRLYRFALVIPFMLLVGAGALVGMVKFEDTMQTVDVDGPAVQTLFGIMALMSAMSYCGASLMLFRYYFHTVEGTVLLVVLHVIVFVIIGSAAAVLPTVAITFIYIVEMVLAFGELFMVVISSAAFVGTSCQRVRAKIS